MKYQLYSNVKTKIRRHDISSLTPIGGAKGSGIQFEELKGSEDYAVVSKDDFGFSVHVLSKTFSEKQKKLMPGQSLIINDLELFCIEVDQDKHQKLTTQTNFLSEFTQLLSSFAQSDAINISMTHLLESLVSDLEMEKGLVISKQDQSTYKLCANVGVKKEDPWLSESLIQKALKKNEPIFIQNIIGSEFDSKQSLLATGFLSAFVWPLIVRGKNIGILLVGSSKPHSGMNSELKIKAELYSQIAGLMLSFYGRELQVREELKLLKKSLKSQNGPFLTNDKFLMETCTMASQVAGSDLSVFIGGETGVGKELMANWIHQQSGRSRQSFVAVNCGAIPSELLESLLFGHKKGAFSGAYNDQIGKFQSAEGGTLFLDEIGDLPLQLQVKLLRVLQEKCIEPLGSKRPIPVNVRILAASHKNLSDLVEQQKFREDLFYRIAEVNLIIPPLRERPEDIDLLASHFLKEFAEDKHFSNDVWNWLKEQKWRGNIRELKSSIKRAAILSQAKEITQDVFTKGVPTQSKAVEQNWLGGKDLEDAKHNFVNIKVKEALKRENGNKTKAARLLGVAPRTLFRYLNSQSGMTSLSYRSDKDVQV